MFIEIDRNEVNTFDVLEAPQGKPRSLIARLNLMQEARNRGLREANQRGCLLINKVNDDVPATMHSRTRQGM